MREEYTIMIPQMSPVHFRHVEVAMKQAGYKACLLYTSPAAYGITTSTVFQATGHGILSLWSSLIRQLIGALPVAFILSRFIGITGVWMAFPLAEAIGIIYVICAFIWLYKREIKTMI